MSRSTQLITHQQLPLVTYPCPNPLYPLHCIILHRARAPTSLQRLPGRCHSIRPKRLARSDILGISRHIIYPTESRPLSVLDNVLSLVSTLQRDAISTPNGETDAARLASGTIDVNTSSEDVSIVPADSEYHSYLAVFSKTLADRPREHRSFAQQIPRRG